MGSMYRIQYSLASKQAPMLIPIAKNIPQLPGCGYLSTKMGCPFSANSAKLSVFFPANMIHAKTDLRKLPCSKYMGKLILPSHRKSLLLMNFRAWGEMMIAKTRKKDPIVPHTRAGSWLAGKILLPRRSSLLLHGVTSALFRGNDIKYKPRMAKGGEMIGE
jgi:hypothetical protein